MSKLRLLILAENFSMANGYAIVDRTPPINIRRDPGVLVITHMHDLNRLHGVRLTNDFEVAHVGYVRPRLIYEAHHLVDMARNRH